MGVGLSVGVGVQGPIEIVGTGSIPVNANHPVVGMFGEELLLAYKYTSEGNPDSLVVKVIKFQ